VSRKEGRNKGRDNGRNEGTQKEREDREGRTGERWRNGRMLGVVLYMTVDGGRCNGNAGSGTGNGYK
jgi:hypothetical protein